MSKTFDEIVVRIDQQRQVVVVYLAGGDRPVRETDASEFFKLIEIPIDQLLTGDTTAAESRFGSVMLSALEALRRDGTDSLSKVYDTDANRKAQRLLEERARGGDPTAQNALGILYLAESLRLRDLHLLDEAENWLKEASARGHEQATGFLKGSWSDIKKRYADRIKSLG